MEIYTIFSCEEEQGVNYGKAVPKGQPPIHYDPQTEEGYAGIAEHWGEEEAIIALMRNTLIDAKRMLLALLKGSNEFTGNQVVSTVKDIDKALGKRRS